MSLVLADKTWIIDNVGAAKTDFSSASGDPSVAPSTSLGFHINTTARTLWYYDSTGSEWVTMSDVVSADIDILSAAFLENTSEISSVSAALNTIASIFSGATSSVNGTSGSVPAPLSGQEEFILQGNGTWIENVPADTDYNSQDQILSGHIDTNTTDITAISGDVAGIDYNSQDQILSGYIDTNTTDITAISGDVADIDYNSQDQILSGYIDANIANIETISGELAGSSSSTTTDSDRNLIIGENALEDLSTGTGNVALGYNALNATTTGIENVAVGENALELNVTGKQNVALGTYALSGNTTGSNSVAIGYKALYLNNANGSIGIGNLAGYGNTSHTGLIAIGYQAANGNDGDYNIAIGSYSQYGMAGVYSGCENVSVGAAACRNIADGKYNSALGHWASYLIRDGLGNAIVGYKSQYSNIYNNYNSSIGYESLYTSTADYNTAIGYKAGRAITTGNYITAVGSNALDGNVDYTNTTGIGYAAQVTASNQVQIGNSATTTYAYGAVQDRSDIRDKADVKNTELGLEFIKELRPVDFRWDMRDAYRTEMPSTEDMTDEESKATTDKWLESNKMANLTHDGTHKRNRFHHGFIAQEVKETMDKLDVDFAGFQDHKKAGGEDVLSLGYSELIPILVKAIQDLEAIVNTK